MAKLSKNYNWSDMLRALRDDAESHHQELVEQVKFLDQQEKYREWKASGLPPKNVFLYCNEEELCFHLALGISSFEIPSVPKGALLEFWQVDDNKEKEFLLYDYRIEDADSFDVSRVKGVIEELSPSYTLGMNLVEIDPGEYRVHVFNGTSSDVESVVRRQMRSDLCLIETLDSSLEDYTESCFYGVDSPIPQLWLSPLGSGVDPGNFLFIKKIGQLFLRPLELYQLLSRLAVWPKLNAIAISGMLLSFGLGMAFDRIDGAIAAAIVGSPPASATDVDSDLLADSAEALNLPGTTVASVTPRKVSASPSKPLQLGRLGVETIKSELDPIEYTNPSTTNVEMMQNQPESKKETPSDTSPESDSPLGGTLTATQSANINKPQSGESR